MINKKNDAVIPLVLIVAVLLAALIATRSGVANPLLEFQEAQEKDLNEYRSGNLQRDEMVELLRYNEAHFYERLKRMITDSRYSVLDRCDAAAKALALLSHDPEPATLIDSVNDLLEDENISEKNRTRLAEYLFSHGVAQLHSNVSSEGSIRLNKILSRWMEYLDGRVKEEHGYWRAIAFYQAALTYAQLVDNLDLTDRFIDKGKSTSIEMLKLEQSGDLEKKREQLFGVFMHFYETDIAFRHSDASREQLEKHLKMTLSELQTIPDLYARVVEDYFARVDFDGLYQKALFLEEHLRFLSTSSEGRDLVYWLHSFYASRDDQINILRMQKVIQNMEKN